MEREQFADLAWCDSIGFGFLMKIVPIVNDVIHLIIRSWSVGQTFSHLMASGIFGHLATSNLYTTSTQTNPSRAKRKQIVVVTLNLMMQALSANPIQNAMLQTPCTSPCVSHTSSEFANNEEWFRWGFASCCFIALGAGRVGAAGHSGRGRPTACAA